MDVSKAVGSGGTLQQHSCWVRQVLQAMSQSSAGYRYSGAHHSSMTIKIGAVHYHWIHC